MPEISISRTTTLEFQDFSRTFAFFQDFPASVWTLYRVLDRSSVGAEGLRDAPQLWNIALEKASNREMTFKDTQSHYTHTNVLRPSSILSGTTWVSRHRKGQTNRDLLEQEIVSDSGIDWAICKSAPWPGHITTPASHHSGQMPFLPSNQQHQSTEGKILQLLLLDRPYTSVTSCWWPVVTTSLSTLFPRYYHFSSVHDCQWP